MGQAKAVTYDEVAKMCYRITQQDGGCLPNEMLRLITAWKLQNSALRTLFDLFHLDADGLRVQSDSVRLNNLNALKESVGLAGYSS